MSQAAIMSVVKMMESVPEPVQEQVAEHLRDYLDHLPDASHDTLKKAARNPTTPNHDPLDSDFARAVFALPTLPGRGGAVITSEHVRELLEGED